MKTTTNTKFTFKNKNVQTALLCGGMVIIGAFGGISFAKRIPTIKDGSEVVATLDGKKITANSLYTELKEQGGSSVLMGLVDNFITEKETDDEDLKNAKEYADGYIENLKAQYSSSGENFEDALTQAGYSDEDTFKELLIDDNLKGIVAEQYIKENNFSDSDVKKYYDENVEGSMVVRYILVQPETKEGDSEEAIKKAEEAALKEANEIIAKLKKDEDFATLAKKHSDDSSTASEGGLYNGFTKDAVVPEFWEASVALKDNKYTTEPVESSYGYFVIQRIKQNEKPSLKDAEKDCLDKLYEKALQEDQNLIPVAWTKIRKNYKLDIIDSKIKTSYDKDVKNLK